MALVFTDGFESELNSNDATKLIQSGKWSNASNTGQMAVDTFPRGTISSSRYGTGAYFYMSNPGNSWLHSRVFSPRAKWTLGMAAFASSPAQQVFLAGLDDSGTGFQLSVFWDSTSNVLSLWRGFGLSLLATSTVPISRLTWHYFEFRFEIAPALGYCELRVDGVTVLTFSGNTQQTINQRASSFQFGNGGSNGVDLGIDDVYLCDDNPGYGSAETPFMGPIRIQTIVPSANGTTTQFSAIGAASNFAATTQMPADDDTSYVSGTYPNTDTYVHTDLPANASAIRAVVANIRARKDDAGQRQIAAIVRSGSLIAPLGGIGLADSYVTNQWSMETNPITGSAWTPAEVNAAEYGVTVPA